MLQLARDYEQVAATGAPQLDLLAVLRVLRRRWPTVAAALCIATSLGAAYMIFATRKYTSTFVVLIDRPKASLLAREDASADRLMDPGLVESQVEVLKSDSVMRLVVDNLSLIHDETVVGVGPGLISQAVAFVDNLLPATLPGAVDANEGMTQFAIERLQEKFKVQRIGVTYVIQASYTNVDPVRSAKIANGIADAYLTSQLDARFDTNRRAADWLQGRLERLREKTREAELAVQTYKAEHGIVETARGLITDQQLNDASASLANAHNETKTAKANLDRVEAILASDDAVNATVPDALKDDVLNRLRAQALDLSSRAADLSIRFGEKHGTVEKLRGQIAELNVTAVEELGRIKESLKSAYESAAEKEQALKADLQTAVATADMASQAQVRLRDLESAAQSYRTMSDNMLDKLQEVTQEQTSPAGDARIISAAATPQKPSSPKLLIVAAVSIFGGLAVGAALALLNEALSSGFKTPDDVQLYAGLECIGTLPRVKVTRAMLRSLAQSPGRQSPARRKIAVGEICVAVSVLALFRDLPRRESRHRRLPLRERGLDYRRGLVGSPRRQDDHLRQSIACHGPNGASDFADRWGSSQSLVDTNTVAGSAQRAR